MKVVELRAQTEQELNVNLSALLRDLFKLRVMKSSGATVKDHLFRQMRRDVARIKTILTEKAGVL
jgi:large subunit ribosomal protein L29